MASSWQSMRKAAARLREMLAQAAANQWNAPRDKVIVEQKTLIHRDTQERLKK